MHSTSADDISSNGMRRAPATVLRRAAARSFGETAMCNRNLTVTESRSAQRWQARAKRLSAAIVLIAVGISTTAVAAPANCAARADLLNELAKRYSEAPIAVGLANNGALVEVLTSDSGATWTILISQPDGKSCLVAAGEEWQPLKRAATRDRPV
jgi:hypothetical protein